MLKAKHITNLNTSQYDHTTYDCKEESRRSPEGACYSKLRSTFDLIIHVPQNMCFEDNGFFSIVTVVLTNLFCTLPSKTRLFYDTETTTNENSFRIIHHFGWLMCRRNWLYVLYFTRQDIRMPIHRQCLTFFGVRCNCITVPIQYVKRPRQLGLCEICRSCTM